MNVSKFAITTSENNIAPKDLITATANQKPRPP